MYSEKMYISMVTAVIRFQRHALHCTLPVWHGMCSNCDHEV